MKIIFFLGLYASSLLAFKLINGKNACNVSFDTIPKITLMLESDAELSDEDTKDILNNFTEQTSVSFFVSYIGEDLNIQFKDLPKDCTIVLPSPFTLREKPLQEQSLLGSIASSLKYGFFCAGSLASIPLGALPAMQWGAQLGGPLALKYGPSLFVNNYNLLFTTMLSPLWPSWISQIGTLGGWIVGGAAGALGAPLLFIMAFKGSQKLITYAYQSPQECAQAFDDIDDFVLILRDPSQ